MESKSRNVFPRSGDEPNSWQVVLYYALIIISAQIFSTYYLIRNSMDVASVLARSSAILMSVMTVVFLFAFRKKWTQAYSMIFFLLQTLTLFISSWMVQVVYAADTTRIFTPFMGFKLWPIILAFVVPGPYWVNFLLLVLIYIEGAVLWFYLDLPHLPNVALGAEPITSFVFVIVSFVLLYFRYLDSRVIAKRTEALKNSEAEARQALKQLEEDVKTRMDFFARINHEIRTPVSMIAGLSRLGLQKSGDGQREALEKISSAAHRVSDIVNDLLDVSKMESGKLRIRKHRFALDETLYYIDQIAGFRAAEKGIALRLDPAPAECRVLVGDAHRLCQVLLNLVSNAIKFTDRGGVTVRIETSFEAANHRTCVLRFVIKDTGIGIPPDALGSLFKAYQQVDAVDRKTESGTGLGLAICKQLVELMGGSISVDSTPGVGSQFYFSLPFELTETASESMVQA